MGEVKQSAPRPKKRKRPPVTGLRIDRELVRRAKYRALDDRSTLTATVERALVEFLRTKP